MTPTSVMAMAMPNEIGSGSRVLNENKNVNGSRCMIEGGLANWTENEGEKKKRNDHLEGNTVDARVVDKLMRETAEATGAARVLADRVAVLERALAVQARGVGGGGGGRVDGGGATRDKGKGKGKGKDAGHGGAVVGAGDVAVEEDFRVRLRRVEAERDEARQIVREVRAYLLEGHAGGVA